MRLVAATLTVLLATVGLSGDARPTDAPYTLLQFNICGNACSSGGDGIVNALAGAVQHRRPFAVTLNEVCENQFARLAAELPAYRGHFDPTGPKCRNGAPYGNAVLMRGSSLSVIGSWMLPAVIFEEDRRLLCVRSGEVTVCVTHLSVEESNREGQIAAIATVLSGLSGPLVLAGDFNLDPSDPRLDPLYQRYDEVDNGDRTWLNEPAGADVRNEDTFNRHKFDYIFLSVPDWSTTGAHADDPVGGLSDHDALWATATLRPTTPTVPIAHP
jgi:endonuclease/exonuclease/phosphatase family metal-dependent hydrolase